MDFLQEFRTRLRVFVKDARVLGNLQPYAGRLETGDISQALPVQDVERLFSYQSRRPLRFSEASIGPGLVPFVASPRNLKSQSAGETRSTASPLTFFPWLPRLCMDAQLPLWSIIIHERVNPRALRTMQAP